jgi:signal transduction histidine kinase
MRAPDFFRSSALRLALAFAIAMAAATSLIFAFVYWQITAANEALVRVIMVDEAAKGANYSDAELRNALNLRLTRDLRRLDYVALFDVSGALMIGNIEKMPAIPVDGRSHFIAAVQPSGGDQASEPAILVARLRPDGSVLLLGRSLVEVYELRRTVLGALMTAIGPMLLLTLAIGAFFAGRASRRLILIHDTIARIMQGDLQVRLPVGKRPDEIDKVSRDVNLMLDEIVRLLVQIKSVSDNIAHDLRTPLAVVRAKLERGLAGSNDDDLRAATRQALTELDRAMATITALLRISEVESTSRSSGFKPIDLAAICAEVFEFYEPLGKARSIAMILDAGSPVPTLGDGDLMREALSNLIDNAVKFTPDGGTVRVAAAVEAGRPVIRVSDSGSGVEPGERDKIFERFYRTVRSDRVPGIGLGLSIAAAIANLHDFDLRVEDNNPGALFVMSAREAPPARRKDSALNQAPTRALINLQTRPE